MSQVWRRGTETWVAAKGAFEGIAGICAWEGDDRQTAQATLNDLSARGLRVLAFAGLKGSGKNSESESGLEFLGFLGFSDPVRAGVVQAVKQCQDAGIEVKMVSGDHLLTAHAVADSIGLFHSHADLGHQFTGAELDGMDTVTRQAAFKSGAIFARFRPEQKFDLVRALRDSGEVVAVTGDGVNDAPALRAADIGVSMGERATELARATARMVLLKDDFS
jgi:Ca2+-transporting ATPase